MAPCAPTAPDVNTAGPFDMMSLRGHGLARNISPHRDDQDVLIGVHGDRGQSIKSLRSMEPCVVGTALTVRDGTAHDEKCQFDYSPIGHNDDFRTRHRILPQMCQRAGGGSLLSEIL